MRKNILFSALFALVAFSLVSCSSDNDPMTSPSPDEVITPIRINAVYSGSGNGSRSTNRVAYAEAGSNISATWQSGDQLYVYYNGHVNTLTLSEGAGTTTATFTGTILGTPNSNSLLICYVRDANNPSAVSVNNNGEYTYAAGTFLSQDGTLSGAAKCNLYYGTTTYGSGEDISCTFSVNTSMMKFTVSTEGVNAGDEATLIYKSDGTALAQASFTVGEDGRNTIYLTIPAGQYTGEQTVQYVSGTVDESEILSFTKANFVAGQTYSKELYYGDPGISILKIGTNSKYIGYVLAANGKAYTSVSIANEYSTASAMIAYLGEYNGDSGESAYSSKYNHGLAVALTDVTVSGGEGSEAMNGGSAITAAASYTRSCPTASSGWFQPSIFQWMRMLEGCGGGTFTTSISDGMGFSAGDFNSNLSACGGTITQSARYWSSTPNGGSAYWGYEFHRSQVAWFYDYGNVYYVRPAFAF